MERFDVEIGGRLCLNFVNTVGGRISSPDRVTGRDYAARVVGDRLGTYADLLDWGAERGVIAAFERDALRRAAKERTAAAVLRRAVLLREAMYRVFKSLIEGWPPSEGDVSVLNRELAAARRHERLAVIEGAFTWRWEHRAPDIPGSLDRVLWPVVSSAADLLTGAAAGRVRQCGGERCGWLFLDESRSGRRRWCDMQVCGNRAKVRRYRARQRRRT